ncbi:hypothetical protein QA601_13310 [Chitinispirillales bacterium ANBcel5]|uniref:hypothetical protein n=1 Tax=Cellulosispirillum alkaliphilum TaxID=3039283 RepID=UPI002A4FF5D6|nr:hypothetical protein [Chitinispirillales bacterium ANBcel5]
MDRLKIKALPLVLLVLFSSADAIWNISTEGDFRYHGSSNEHWVGVDALTLVARKVVSDSKGDRWDFGLNSEISDNFSSLEIHELYANLKGPLGRWNITAGRMRLPWGLIPEYSTYRYLFDTNEEQTLGFESDNGIMFSGIRGRVDYGIALTQGYGMKLARGVGHGLITGRLGFTLGEFDDYILGVSSAVGRANQGHGHNSDSTTSAQKILSAVDFTLYSGRATSRSEITAGKHDDDFLIGLFSSLDFALRPVLSLNLAGSFVRVGHQNEDYLYTGFSWNTRLLTVRGGYTYSYYGETQHEVSLQLYKLFNFVI